MPDEMFPGMSDEAEPSHTGEMEEHEGMHDKENEDGETALLPKSFFEGQKLKAGEQYYVEIVREYEDEVEVKYPHKIKSEDDEEQHSEANSKLEAMGTEESNPGASGGGY